MPNLTRIASTKECPPGKAIAVDVGSRRIAIFNVDGKYHAIDDACTHAGGNLSEGELQGCVVTCPWHGATFDITSGAVLSAPAADNVAHYNVQVDGDEISVEIP